MFSQHLVQRNLYLHKSRETWDVLHFYSHILIIQCESGFSPGSWPNWRTGRLGEHKWHLKKAVWGWERIPWFHRVKEFFSRMYVWEVQKERKAEYGSFPLIFSYQVLFQVSECFTLGAFIPYLKRNWVISYAPRSSLTTFNIWILP